MECSPTVKSASSHLRLGIVAIGVAGVYVAAVLLFGWGIPCLLMPVALLSLLLGGIAALAGLALRVNRQRARFWRHVAVVLTIIILLPLLSIGPGNYFNLIDLRARLVVALTGGQDELQAWALGLLAKPREGMDENGGGWRVPREYWSKQVRLLLAGSVTIAPVFRDNQEGVLLNYGGGFFHWSIVVGPPGSQPKAMLGDPNSGNVWYRWGDGLYDCHWE